MLDSMFHMCGYLPVDYFTHLLYDQDIVCHFFYVQLFIIVTFPPMRKKCLLSSLFCIISLEDRDTFTSSLSLQFLCNNQLIVNLDSYEGKLW